MGPAIHIEIQAQKHGFGVRYVSFCVKIITVQYTVIINI